MAPLPGINAKEDQEDAGEMLSSSGLVHQWQSKGKGKGRQFV